MRRILEDLQNGFGKSSRKSDSHQISKPTRDIFLINNLNISYFNVHILPVTNENVTSFFQGHIRIIKRSYFLPDTKPDLQEPQFAFTRQTHITKN